MATPRPFLLDLSGCMAAVLRRWRNFTDCLREHPRARTALRATKRVLRPVSSLRQQGRECVYRNLCSRLRGDPVVALPEFGGEFSIDIRSDVFRRILMDGHYEPDRAACCKEFVLPGRDAIDVGANVGFYSVLLARNVSPGRRVLAIEPVPEAITKLEQNALRNGVSESLLAYEGAASDKDVPCELAMVEGKSEYSTIGRLVHPSVQGTKGRTISVEGARLDSLVRRFALDPGFVKIDVEGAELKVLDGAVGLLRETRPILLIEIHRLLLEKRGGSADEVLNCLRRHRYRLACPEKSRRLAVWKDCFSVLCLPEEQGAVLR